MLVMGFDSYKKRLLGWLSYAFGSEIFVTVSLTLFLPLALEQFARENGYLLPDRTERCPASTSDESQTCAVKIGWFWVDSASFSLYVYSISVALQALTVISMGGIADHPPHRKLLLVSFGVAGSLAATAFLLISSSSPVWFLAALLTCIANVSFGASTVAMNAYLPSLAKDSPEVVEILHELQEASGTNSRDDTEEGVGRASEDAEAPLISRTPAQEPTELQTRYETALSRAMSRTSSLGIATGYGAGILMLIVALVPVTKLNGSTFSLRLAIGLSGIAWGIFTIPAALWLPSSVSSEDSGSAPWRETAGDGKWSTRREIAAAWRRLGGMLHPREIKRLRNTFKYLAAWFLLSDGFTTITSTAMLFGKNSLHMKASSLVLIGVFSPMAGIAGSLLCPIIQRRLGWSNLRVIIVIVALASLIPAYGCLGFLSIFKGFGGLTTQGELFGLAIYFGFIYGAFQGFSRAFYAELIPPGEEARWYGLYSITDKSSSFLGPLIVGLISDLTGNIRYGFFFLILMMWAALPALVSVDVERGRKDAREYVYR
ncbi:autophagy-related protein 22-like protein [Roridomyces roridus]|uniref:Autophagy-related protein n=1 Tax=Roridomyces roridus TaxID=1738132 RepID=A0AAD7C7Y3_9AGAR|nr:autophagy-related protein 22-like protein [Roridomyces roridus]